MSQVGVTTGQKMAIQFTSNLQRNRNGMLYFRLTIPADLHHHFHVKSIYKSLETPHIEQTGALQALKNLLALLQEEDLMQALKFDLRIELFSLIRTLMS